MVDMESYERKKEILFESDNCRNFISDCICRVCRKRRETAGKKVLALFEDYNDISPMERSDLTDHQYLICPSRIPAFIFKTRQWGKDRPKPPNLEWT